MDRDEARAYSVKHLFPMQLLSLRRVLLNASFIRVHSQLVRRSLSSARSLVPHLAKSDLFAVAIAYV